MEFEFVTVLHREWSYADLVMMPIMRFDDAVSTPGAEAYRKVLGTLLLFFTSCIKVFTSSYHHYWL